MFKKEAETLTQIYGRIVRFMFGDCVGGGVPNLYNITFCSDRRYWTPTIVFLMLLLWGADIVGTIARCFWFLFLF